MLQVYVIMEHSMQLEGILLKHTIIKNFYVLVTAQHYQGPSTKYSSQAVFWSFRWRTGQTVPLIFFTQRRKLENWFYVNIEDLSLIRSTKTRPFRANLRNMLFHSSRYFMSIKVLLQLWRKCSKCLMWHWQGACLPKFSVQLVEGHCVRGKGKGVKL